MTGSLRLGIVLIILGILVGLTVSGVFGLVMIGVGFIFAIWDHLPNGTPRR